MLQRQAGTCSATVASAAHLVQRAAKAGGEAVKHRCGRQPQQRGAAQHALHHRRAVVVEACQQRGASGCSRLAAGGGSQLVQPLHCHLAHARRRVLCRQQHRRAGLNQRAARGALKRRRQQVQHGLPPLLLLGRCCGVAAGVLGREGRRQGVVQALRAPQVQRPQQAQVQVACRPLARRHALCQRGVRQQAARSTQRHACQQGLQQRLVVRHLWQPLDGSPHQQLQEALDAAALVGQGGQVVHQARHLRTRQGGGRQRWCSARAQAAAAAASPHPCPERRRNPLQCAPLPAS